MGAVAVLAVTGAVTGAAIEAAAGVPVVQGRVDVQAAAEGLVDIVAVTAPDGRAVAGQAARAVALAGKAAATLATVVPVLLAATFVQMTTITAVTGSP